jgi:hypothetical protein
MGWVKERCHGKRYYSPICWWLRIAHRECLTLKKKKN